MSSTSSSMLSRAGQPDFRNEYKEETPPKKLMRHFFWRLVQELLGEARFCEGPHLVLSSREAGDVSVLLALDVPMENIVAVDWRSGEAILARTKFPGLEVVDADIGDYIKSTKKKFVCVFLDFCAWATPVNLNHIALAARTIMQPDALLACNFQVGREQRDMKRKMKKMRQKLEEELAASEEYTPDLDMVSHFSRAYVIQRELEKRTRGLDLQLEARFFYSSRYNSHHGHPWAGQLFWVNPAKRVYKDTDPYYFSTDEDTFRKTVLDLEEKTGRAALLLNIAKSSISAWKAHVTRGTYKR